MTAVQGRCPACRATSLFLGAGGHVTCSRIDCSDPCAADNLLHDKQPGRDKDLKSLRTENAAALSLIRMQDEAIQRVRNLANQLALDSPWGRETAHQFRLAVQPPTPDRPTVDECTADDRRWWNGEKEGDR